MITLRYAHQVVDRVYPASKRNADNVIDYEACRARLYLALEAKHAIKGFEEYRDFVTRASQLKSRPARAA